jgi:Icc-related predicted phosphoesterase
MSDSHDCHDRIDINSLPPADIFIHAGDFTQYSYRGEMDRFRDFLKRLPYKHKIVVAGNHDFVLDRQNYETKHKPKRHKYEKMNSEDEIQKLKEVCTYLDHESTVVEGINIFGSPYQPLFYNWAFQYHSSRAEDIWSEIPKDTELLITHGPPHGILDKSSEGEHAGCLTLMKYVELIRPKVHIFGHIHHSAGTHIGEHTAFYNVAVVNEAYELSHPLTVIEYKRPTE